LVDCLVLWNEFKVNSTHDIKGSDGFSPLYASESIAQVSLAFFPNFTQNLCRFVALKTDHLFLRRNVETHVLSALQLPHNWCEYVEIATGAS
jgi:hypothetical protein